MNNKALYFPASRHGRWRVEKSSNGLSGRGNQEKMLILLRVYKGRESGTKLAYKLPQDEPEWWGGLI